LQVTAARPVLTARAARNYLGHRPKGGLDEQRAGAAVNQGAGEGEFFVGKSRVMP
jgi:hypothetical protein